MQEAVRRSAFLPHLSLSVDHKHRHGNVLAVDSRDDCSNVLQHSHAMEADDFLRNHMMHPACLFH